MPQQFWAGDLYFACKCTNEPVRIFFGLAFAEFYRALLVHDCNDVSFDTEWLIFFRGLKPRVNEFYIILLCFLFNVRSGEAEHETAKAAGVEIGVESPKHWTFNPMDGKLTLHCSKLGLDQDLLRYISAGDAPILQLVWCSLGYQIGWRNPNVKLRVRPGLRFRPHNSWGKTM